MLNIVIAVSLLSCLLCFSFILEAIFSPSSLIRISDTAPVDRLDDRPFFSHQPVPDPFVTPTFSPTYSNLPRATPLFDLEICRFKNEAILISTVSKRSGCLLMCGRRFSTIACEKCWRPPALLPPLLESFPHSERLAPVLTVAFQGYNTNKSFFFKFQTSMLLFVPFSSASVWGV